MSRDKQSHEKNQGPIFFDSLLIAMHTVPKLIFCGSKHIRFSCLCMVYYIQVSVWMILFFWSLKSYQILLLHMKISCKHITT
jgi:hypothetical protein